MNNRKPKVNGQLSVALVFETVMAFVYLAFAYVLLSGSLNDRFNENVTFNDIRLPLGIVLAVYGLFRVYSAIRKIKSTHNDESD